MKQKINNNLNQLEDLFNILHDGDIEEYKYENKVLSLRVDIKYLAKLLNPKYTFFYVIIHGCGEIYFAPWSESIKNIKDLNEIFTSELQILSCKRDAACLFEITCNCFYKNLSNAPYSGGTLFISAQGFEVLDEDLNKIEIMLLEEICKQYWDNFGKRKESRLT